MNLSEAVKHQIEHHRSPEFLPLQRAQPLDPNVRLFPCRRRKRNQFRAPGLSNAICIFIALFAACLQAADKPNVLLIITDDQGYGDFGVHGNSNVQTPVLDRFAREGIRFDRFFVSPVCAPTRASLLTGRWWLRSGVWGVTQMKENMRPGEVTLAEALKPSGYKTGYFGKWHNGEQFPWTPQGQGFDEFFGFNNGHWNNYFDTDLVKGSRFVKTEGYIADVLTGEAIRFIEERKSQPFFAYVAYNTPHSPFQVPDKYFDKYKARGLDDTLATIYGMCENLDDNIGRLLSTLDRLKLRENTIVLFLTDNGANTDRFNADMRGRKGSVHEGGTRVPLFLQWPARYKNPRLIKEIAAHIDVFPTLLELCGTPVPSGVKLDGRSVVPLLNGNSENWPDRMLFTQQAGGVNGPDMNRGAVRTQRYRAVIEPAGGKKKDAATWQLYDMIEDPGQTRDIANDQPAVVKQLASSYEAWFKEVTRDGFAKPRIPVGYSEHNPIFVYAPQASFTGAIRFFAGPGFAHDWLTGWTNSSDKISFELDIVRDGTFKVELGYACPSKDAGSRLRVRCGEVAMEATVNAAPAAPLVLKHRDGGKETYRNRDWGSLDLGKARLAAGPATLTIEAIRQTGDEILELKHVKLTRVN